MSDRNKLFKKIGIWFLALAAFGGLVTLGAWYYLFQVNTFFLTLDPAGGESALVEYGSSYADPTLQVLLKGTHVLRAGYPLTEVLVETESQPDEAELGKHSRTYRAAWKGLTAETTRDFLVIDSQCPVITLKKDSDDLEAGKPYAEAGFTATDNHDGDITARVIRTEVPGKVTYSVVDSSGNPFVVEREIPLYDIDPPVLTLEQGEFISLTFGDVYEEPGYSALDDADGDLTELVEREGEVDTWTPGTYIISYRVTDTCGNVAEMERTVEVAAQPRPETVWPQKPTIYLTFDDGPGPYTMTLLNTLDRYGVKATFFVCNCYGSVMKQIVKRGHAIGVHTMSHDYNAIYSSPEAFFADMKGMQQVIYDNTGISTSLMRFPGGSSNLVSRNACEGVMTILSEAVQDAGFQYFDWNVDSDDAGAAYKSTERIYQNVINGVSTKRVSIVLQHDSNGYSVDAVEKIIRWGKANGYRFAKLEPTSPTFHHGVQN